MSIITNWYIESIYDERIEMDVWYVSYSNNSGWKGSMDLCPVYDEGGDNDSWYWAIEMAIQYMEDFEKWILVPHEEREPFSPFSLRDESYRKVARILGYPSGDPFIEKAA